MGSLRCIESGAAANKFTSNKCELDAPQHGIEVEMGHVKFLFQFLLVDMDPLRGRHVWGGIRWDLDLNNERRVKMLVSCCQGRISLIGSGSVMTCGRGRAIRGAAKV